MKQFLKKGFAKNSEVSQIIKKAFSILVLELKPTTIAGWRFLKFQKNSKLLHPTVQCAVYSTLVQYFKEEKKVNCFY